MGEGGLTEALERHEDEKRESARNQCKTSFEGICGEIREISSSMPGMESDAVDSFESKFRVPIERFLSKEYKNEQEAYDEANLVMSLIREPVTEIRDKLITAHSYSPAVESIKQDADLLNPNVAQKVQAHVQAWTIDDLDGILPTIRKEVLDPYVETFK